MQFINVLTRTSLGAAILASCCLPAVVNGQVQAGIDSQSTVTKPTTEPVFRVSRLAKANPSLDSTAVAELPAANVRVNNDPTMMPAINRRESVASAAPISLDSKPIAPKVVAHPLDRAIEIANGSLTSIRANLYDYTARMAKRESINGQLGKTTFMDIKIRCPRVTPQGQQTPFSIYMKFLQPRDASGREVLWVDGP